MDKKVKNVLDGSHNKGLDKLKPTNRENTAAWADEKSTLGISNVSIPSDYDVEKAKNWVDNGSQL